MLRSLLTLALSVFLLAEASAQTVPATKAKAKSAKATARAAARANKKAQRVALKKAGIKSVALNDGWPPLDDTQTTVASTTTANDGWAVDAAGAATSRGEIDNQNISVAPGMPVHMRTSNGLTPYSVRPARKSASSQTTLGN